MKVSLLPLVTAPTGAEDLVIVSAGAAKRANLGNILGTINSTGAAQVTAVNAAGATQVAAVSALIPDLQSAGGTKNLFPDPFMTSAVIGGYTDNAVFHLEGAWTGIAAPTAISPYPAGRVLVRPNANVTVPAIRLYLEPLGMQVGDVFQVAQELAFLSAGSLTTGTIALGQWCGRDGLNIGAQFILYAATTGNPLNNTAYHMFNSGNLTVPAGAWQLLIYCSQWGTAPYGIASTQVVKGAALTKPVQRLALSDSANRLLKLEAYNPGDPANNVLMRRTTYASATLMPFVGTNQGLGSNFAAYGGYGSSYLAAACPVGGFNLISSTWVWTPSATNGPVRLYAMVRTCATGGNPLSIGKTIAWGYIDCDPSTGNAGQEPIQLFDPVTNLPKTVMPSDLLDLMGIAVTGVTASGGSPLQMFVTYGIMSNADPAIVGFQSTSNQPAGLLAPWSSTFTGPGSWSWMPNLLLAVSPVTKNNVPSPTFVSRMAAEDTPALIACPQKMWAIVGQQTWLNYEPLLQRDVRRTIFQANYSTSIPGAFPTNPSGCYQEGFVLQPAAAGTTTLTVKALNQDTVFDTKAVSIVTCLASAGAGTKSFLMLGDSMTANGSMQSGLNALAAADGVTLITNVGTMGANPTKNEGYSGMPLGIFFTSGNPFFNPATSTFDFAYYVANSLAGVPPTHVMIAGGFWNVCAAASDAAALGLSQAACTTINTMITSIHAYSATIKVAVWGQPAQPREGQDGQARPVTTVAQTQVSRNLKTLAGQVIATFSGQEASNTFVVAVNAATNPNTAYSMLDYAPMNNIVAHRVSSAAPYANYAALAADLSPSHNTIVRVTNGSGVLYYVKQGATGQGQWRGVNATDGFVRRFTDTIHGDLYQGAAQTFAWIKNNP